MDNLAIVHLIAGGSAGFVETCVMTPVDMIKVRLQIQKGTGGPNKCASIFDCSKKIIKHEGFLSFYKGILPPLIGETPKRAIKFFSYEQYKNIYSKILPANNFLIILVSSLCAGVTEGLVSHPFDIVKIQLQAEKSKFNMAPSAIQKAKQLFCVDEMLGHRLRRGLTSVLARNGTFNTIYLSFYQTTKQLIPENTEKKMALFYKFLLGTLGGTVGSMCNVPFDVALSRIQSQPFESQTSERPTNFDAALRTSAASSDSRVKGSDPTKHFTNCTSRMDVIGSSRGHCITRFIPSTVSILQKCVANGSHIVLQTRVSPQTVSLAQFHRLNNERHAGSFEVNATATPKYKTCFGTICTVFKEEGFLALYKGLLPKIIRLGPGGGLMIVVYEYVNQKLQFLV